MRTRILPVCDLVERPDGCATTAAAECLQMFETVSAEKPVQKVLSIVYADANGITTRELIGDVSLLGSNEIDLKRVEFRRLTLPSPRSRRREH